MLRQISRRNVLLLHKAFQCRLYGRKINPRISKIQVFFQHIPFSTTSVKCSDKGEQPPIQNSEELPEILREKCKKWKQAIKAEQQAQEGKYRWMNCSLKCTNVLSSFNTTKLIMSLEKLSKESKQVFLKYFKISTPVRLRPSIADPWKEELIGRINTIYHQDKSGDPGLFTRISFNRNIDRKQEQEIKNSLFDIKIGENSKFSNQLEFLARSNEWIGMPGFNAMLCAFKCKPLPSCEQIGQDPMDSIEEKNSLDQSQLAALSAALNPKRPIVAIHGPPGTGKTRSLVSYLEELGKQGKRSIVLLPSLTALYNLIGNYQEKICNLDFLILREFDEILAKKIIQDPKICLFIKERSMHKSSKNIQGQKTRKYYKMTNYLQHEMEKAAKELLEEIVDVRQQGIEESHELKGLEEKKYIEENGQIVFATLSRAMINLLTRMQITFDILIVEEATDINELETWWMGLALAPIIRVFGNRDSPGMPVSSPEALAVDFGKSLLQRLDEEFGPEVNFHLQRQYRSAPAIQEWPNSVFYGKRAAETDESVKNIHLNDLLVPDAKVITDPLVLVDLSKLEDGWHENMFESKQGGRSWYNWGEALLVAEHLRQLFKNSKHSQIQIACLTQFVAQNLTVRKIFERFFGSQLENFRMVRFEKNTEFQGQSVDVVLKSFVTKPPSHVFKKHYNLKYLAFEMTRARRQFILMAKREWLEEGSDESRQLLVTFKNHGQIIGPNDLLQMNPKKFNHMLKEMAQ